MPTKKKHPVKEKAKRTLTEALDQAPSTMLGKLSVSKLEIVSASLTKANMMNVAYVKVFDQANSHHIAEECQNEAHQDLRHAFRKLVPHLVIMVGLEEKVLKGKPIHPQDFEAKELEDIKVTGYHLKGAHDDRKIILIGQKKIDNRAFCFNTPLLKFEDTAFPYKFVDELESVIDEIDSEVRLYLNGKFAPPSQQVLPLPEGEEEGNDVAFENEE